MSLATTVNKFRTQANGSLTEFSFSFTVPSVSDLKVYTVVRATGAATLKTLTTHYTVTLNPVTPGGVVTFLSAPASTLDVLGVRVIALTQPTDIPNLGLIREEQLEDVYDRMTMIMQQLQEQIDRCIIQGVAGAGDFTLPAAVDGLILGWDENGDLVNIDLGDAVDDAIGTSITDAVASATAAASASASAASASASSAAAQVVLAAAEVDLAEAQVALAVAAKAAAETAETNAETAETNAETAQGLAEDARDAAEAAVASVDLPIIGVGDAGKLLTVKNDETGYELLDQSGFLSPNAFFGDGSDGSVTFDGSATILGLVPSGNVYTMTRDIYCDDITINNGVTIRPAGFRIFAAGTLTNNGTITVAGSAGGNGSGGTGGSAGTAGGAIGALGSGGAGGAGGSAGDGNAASSTPVGIGGSGGTGGTGSGSSGGPGAAGTVTVRGMRELRTTFVYGASTLLGGGGGGSGAGANSSGGAGSGGGGGGGGGFIFISANAVDNTNGTISANGGVGGNGAVNGGGGGGGGGGVIYMIYMTLVAGTISASGGAGGTGAGGGTTGSNGSAGTVLKYNATSGSFV